MRLNTIVLLTGHIVLLATFGALWHDLPSDGRKPRFVGTKLEPYITVGFFSAFALAAGVIALGFLAYFGNDWRGHSTDLNQNGLPSTAPFSRFLLQQILLAESR